MLFLFSMPEPRNDIPCPVCGQENWIDDVGGHNGCYGSKEAYDEACKVDVLAVKEIRAARRARYEIL